MAAQLTDPAEYLSTAVVLVNGGLTIQYMNPAAEALFATSARACIGKPLAAVLPNSPALMARLAATLPDAKAWMMRELSLALGGRGEPVTVDLAVNPAGAARIALEFAAQDRHLRISREEQLQAQQFASRALARGLAHEIKNPIGGLRGAAQLLERRLDDPGLREYTRVIIQEADRLAGLVDSMLGPTRAPRMRETNIHQVTEHVARLVEGEVPASVQVVRQYDPSLPEFMADPDHLTQALLNIVRNAAQALDGAGTITVLTRVERQVTLGQQLHRQVIAIDVVDDGPGVPADLRERIFLPLVTTRAEGTGLGLAIAQSLIARHGGLVECESRPGRTVFTILLPLEHSDA